MTKEDDEALYTMAGHLRSSATNASHLIALRLARGSIRESDKVRILDHLEAIRLAAAEIERIVRFPDPKDRPDCPVANPESR